MVDFNINFLKGLNFEKTDYNKSAHEIWDEIGNSLFDGEIPEEAEEQIQDLMEDLMDAFADFKGAMETIKGTDKSGSANEPDKAEEAPKSDGTQETEGTQGAQATEGVDGVDGVKHFGDNPEVAQTPTITEEQQKRVDVYVNMAISDLEVQGFQQLDSKITTDENNNPTKEVINFKDSSGQRATITVTYDEQGRVKTLVKQGPTSKAKDRYIREFVYREDGNVQVNKYIGSFDGENGYFLERKYDLIKPDGTTKQFSQGSHELEVKQKED